MAITFNCPACTQAISVPDQLAGKRGKCPGCGQVVVIPGTPAAAADPAPRPADQVHRAEGAPIGVAPGAPTKTCKFCAETIAASADECPHCGESTRRSPQRNSGRHVGSVIDVGGVIGTSFHAMFGQLGAFLTLGGLVLSPILLVSLYGTQVIPAHTGPVRNQATMMVAVATAVLLMLLSPIVTGALSYGTFSHLCGRPVAIGPCLSVGVKRGLSVFVVALCQGLLVFVGTLCCCIPGFIWMAMYSIVVPIAVVEGTGVGGAFERSKLLTDGSRWPIFFSLFLLGTMNAFVQWAVEAGFAATKPKGALIMVGAVLAFGVTVFFTALNAIAQSTIYYQLRMAKEGLQSDELLAVFD